MLFQNPKVKLDSLNESLQLKLIENGTLQMNEGDAENLEDLWKGIKGDGVVQIKVSKVVEAKRVSLAIMLETEDEQAWILGPEA